MKMTTLRILLIVIAAAATPLATCFGQRPDTEEAAAVERANAEIDVVFGNLMKALDKSQQANLREAEAAWIKWRYAEANLIARFTSVGGTAYRADYLIALRTLIEQRNAVLQGYLRQVKQGR